MNRIALVSLFTLGLAACDSAPGEAPAGNAAARASVPQPSTAEIAAAREAARQNVSDRLKNSPALTGELRVPTAAELAEGTAPPRRSQSGKVETLQQPFFSVPMWLSCPSLWYGNPTWWSGVAVLELLKSTGAIASRNSCNDVVKTTSSAAWFGELYGLSVPEIAALQLIAVAGGSCACWYVF